VPRHLQPEALDQTLYLAPLLPQAAAVEEAQILATQIQPLEMAVLVVAAQSTIAPQAARETRLALHRPKVAMAEPD